MYDVYVAFDAVCDMLPLLGVSPDGSLFAAGYFYNTINIYDSLTHELKRPLKIHNDGILCIRFANNRTLLVGTSSGNLQVIPI